MSRITMLSAAECRRHVVECARLARAAITKKQQDIIFSMARSWETLAAQAERLERQKALDAQNPGAKGSGPAAGRKKKKPLGEPPGGDIP